MNRNGESCTAPEPGIKDWVLGAGQGCNVRRDKGGVELEDRFKARREG